MYRQYDIYTYDIYLTYKSAANDTDIIDIDIGSDIQTDKQKQSQTTNDILRVTTLKILQNSLTFP